MCRSLLQKYFYVICYAYVICLLQNPLHVCVNLRKLKCCGVIFLRDSHNKYHWLPSMSQWLNYAIEWNEVSIPSRQKDMSFPNSCIANEIGSNVWYFSFFVSFLVSLGGDKVSMLTHICPHKPLRKIEVIIRNHQADSPLCVWPDVWSDDLQVQKNVWFKYDLGQKYQAPQVRPGRTPRSWQYISCHWDACSNHSAISEIIVIHDTECPYWDQVSLNNTKPNETSFLVCRGSQFGQSNSKS